MIFERLISLVEEAENYLENAKETDAEFKKYRTLIKNKKYINEYWMVSDYIEAGFTMNDLIDFKIVNKIDDNLFEDEWQFQYDKDGNKAYKN